MATLLPQADFDAQEHGAFLRVYEKQKAAEEFRLAYKLLTLFAPCTCAYCHEDELIARHQVSVLENRIEYNHPISCCWCILDSTHVIYFDRAIVSEVPTVAGCCNPAPMLCPTCFDICGRGVALKGGNCLSAAQVLLPGQGLSLCCQPVLILQGIPEPDRLIQAIKDAKARAQLLKDARQGATTPAYSQSFQPQMPPFQGGAPQTQQMGGYNPVA
eukprot:gnl/Spiro4/8927_TR4717_c0_g1_i1.p1 gnl/Spiro4/8927_TR4717_c0_g1~~gnl/Spiro4/8927_TR4717_c0_g1_i1.p1  ORF type:complete len:231 (+),score=58.76 gnl/Spiro4/8927_TR4717_c0_g1_i1:50-694(+)